MDVEKELRTAFDAGDSQEASLSTIFIGNPGTGKSSIMNCHVGEVMFQSGLSTQGTGITFRLDRWFHKGTWYLDTPGLADINLRQQAANAIDEALQRGGSFHIVFVITLESGRLRADDLTTMKLVFDAVGEQITDHSFSILVNKCNETLLSRLEHDVWVKIFHQSCRDLGLKVTDHIHFVPHIEAMHDRDNVVLKLDAATATFLDELVRIEIDGKQVEKVKAQNFQQMMVEMAALTRALGEAQQETLRQTAARRISMDECSEAKREADAENRRREKAEEKAAAECANAAHQAAARKIAEEQAAAATEHAKAIAAAKERAEQDAEATAAAAAAARASLEVELRRQAEASKKAEEAAAQAMAVAQAEIQKHRAIREEAEAEVEREGAARNKADEAWGRTMIAMRSVEERVEVRSAVEVPCANASSEFPSERLSAKRFSAKLQMRMVADKKGSDTLLMYMREKNWLRLKNWFVGYDEGGIISEMRGLADATLQNVFTVEAAKSNTWTTDFISVGLASSKVASWRLLDVNGEVVFEGPDAHSHFVSGSWIYYVDKAGQMSSYTMKE